MKDRYLLETNKDKYNINKGRKYLDIEKDKELIQFIKFNRKLGNAVTFFRLTLQLIKIDPKRKEYSFKTNRNWVYLFLIKNNYVQRKPSHLGQKLPNNIIDEISHFLSEFYDYRAFNKIDNCVICNNDETPIFLNMPSSKTIEKKGKKILLFIHKIKKNVESLYY